VFTVDPDELDKVADEGERIHSWYVAGRRPLVDGLRAAEQTLPGWAAAPILDQVAAWWSSDFAAFDGNVAATVDALRVAAHDYRAGDQASADLFRYLR
jgi:hypothetical protein